jgi:hypothetical protein
MYQMIKKKLNSLIRSLLAESGFDTVPRYSGLNGMIGWELEKYGKMSGHGLLGKLTLTLPTKTIIRLLPTCQTIKYELPDIDCFFDIELGVTLVHVDTIRNELYSNVIINLSPHINPEQYDLPCIVLKCGGWNTIDLIACLIPQLIEENNALDSLDEEVTSDDEVTIDDEEMQYMLALQMQFAGNESADELDDLDDLTYGANHISHIKNLLHGPNKNVLSQEEIQYMQEIQDTMYVDEPYDIDDVIQKSTNRVYIPHLLLPMNGLGPSMNTVGVHHNNVNNDDGGEYWGESSDELPYHDMNTESNYKQKYEQLLTEKEIPDSITLKCKICYINQCNVLFDACDHMCACNICANKITKCPVCRAMFKKFRTVVLS